MGDSPLTRERVLATAEDVLRRYGPAKATVLDVAQALGVSHGNVYRHFASKAELRDAALRGWLERVAAPLQAIADSRAAPARRLRHWLTACVTPSAANPAAIRSCLALMACWPARHARWSTTMWAG